MSEILLYDSTNYGPADLFRRSVRICVLIDRELTYDLETLKKRCQLLTEFYLRIFIDIEFSFEVVKDGIPMDTIQWSTALLPLRDGGFVQTATLSNPSVAFNLVPYASGYDVCVAWFHPKNWKSLHNIALTIPEKILGTSVITMCVQEKGIDSRWQSRYDGYSWTGVLAHELSHVLDLSCTTVPRAQNNGDYYVNGMDNTHYYDYILKDLSHKKEEINILNFKGFEVAGMTRLFGYTNAPSRKTWPFSGIPDPSKVYRSSDWRMFFRYKGVMKWESITEAEFTYAIKNGTEWVEMAVQEANNIQINYLGLELPPFKGKSIIERLVPTDSWLHRWLKLCGWVENITIIK